MKEPFFIWVTGSNVKSNFARRGDYTLCGFVVLGVMRYNVHVYMTLGKYQSNTGHLAVNCYRLETGIISVEFGRSVSYD